VRGVIRSAYPRRLFAGLAFAAALLLALAPSASRLLRYAPTPGAAEQAALCTHAGLQYVDAAAPHDHRGGDPQHAHGEDGDCAYCPLLAHGALPSVAAVFVLRPAPPAQRPASRQDFVPRAAFLLAARPRGPPPAIAG
jgi:hypothetical protein